MIFVLVASFSSALALLVNSVSTLSPVIINFGPLIALPLALVGFLDDRYSLPAIWRYCVQLFTALVLILFSPLVSLSVDMLPLLFLLLISVTAVINFTNFMDGLDGLLGGCMFVIICTLLVKLSAPWSSWALVGALFGFLIWNWCPAKLFMGDVGSTFLGAVFAFFVLQASS